MTSGSQLGSAARQNLPCTARWTDGYPSRRVFEQELDVLLEFADSQCQLREFVPRICCKNTQRDEALNELRVAYFLRGSGFNVLRWGPTGLGRTVGEYLIGDANGRQVFVEVKSPGWESELSRVELQSGRAKQPKYKGLGGGAARHPKYLQDCIASHYLKFAPTQANLLVISDDFFVPLDFVLPYATDIALYSRPGEWGTEAGFFMCSKFQNIGGLGVFTAEGGPTGVEYRFRVFDNPFALPSTSLPDSLMKSYDPILVSGSSLGTTL